MLLLMFALPFGLSAQILDPVTWDFEIKELESGKYEVKLNANLEEGWYIYSANLPSDEGPIPTSISFSSPDNIATIGKVIEEGKKVEGFDELFGMNVIKFSSNVSFSQKISAKELEYLKGNVRFMTCDQHKCLPPKQIPFELQPE